MCANEKNAHTNRLDDKNENWFFHFLRPQKVNGMRWKKSVTTSLFLCLTVSAAGFDFFSFITEHKIVRRFMAVYLLT